MSARCLPVHRMHPSCRKFFHESSEFLLFGCRKQWTHLFLGSKFERASQGYEVLMILIPEYITMQLKLFVNRSLPPANPQVVQVMQQTQHKDTREPLWFTKLTCGNSLFSGRGSEIPIPLESGRFPVSWPLSMSDPGGPAGGAKSHPILLQKMTISGHFRELN